MGRVPALGGNGLNALPARHHRPGRSCERLSGERPTSCGAFFEAGVISSLDVVACEGQCRAAPMSTWRHQPTDRAARIRVDLTARPRVGRRLSAAAASGWRQARAWGTPYRGDGHVDWGHRGDAESARLRAPRSSFPQLLSVLWERSRALALQPISRPGRVIRCSPGRQRRHPSGIGPAGRRRR